MHLTKMEMRDYGCLADVKLELTSLHALIGPNDSGKSTILRAVRALMHIGNAGMGTLQSSFVPEAAGLGSESSSSIGGTLGKSLYFSVGARPGLGFLVQTRYPGSPDEPTHASNSSELVEHLRRRDGGLAKAVGLSPGLGEFLSKPAHLVRLDADALRKQSSLIPEDDLVAFTEWDVGGMRGDRLPGVYDAIMNRGDGAFATIAQQVRSLFPTVRNVRLRTVSQSEKCLEVELTNGTRVPAAQMSEGLLYFLAYAALPYLSPASILLVEEPENGLHPARIRDVMNVLKEISKSTQVLIATHSPLVVNELEGDQVTVVTRDVERGTQVRRLSQTPDYAVRSKVYQPGELWLSYANGVDEADLFAEPKSGT